MALRVIRAGRRATGDVNTYIGETGTVFYSESTGTLRLSDGVTPGGINNVIPVATTTQVGGIKAGPGVNINSQGVLTINVAGLDTGFGDFYAYTDTGPQGGTASWLSSVNTNEEIVIASNGTGSVALVGRFGVYAPDGPLNTRNPNFLVNDDGQVTMRVPTTDPTAGAVKIIGSLSGSFVPPINTGVMLHLTGNNNDASRLYNDAIGSFAAFVARRYNNLASAPTAVLANEEIMRLSGTAHNGTTIPGGANQRITYRALGNQTLTNQGGSIEFATTPLNSTTLATVATIDSANGFTVTKATITGNANVGNIGTSGVFVGNLTGNASGSAATVTASSQPNITSTGTLTALTVSGNANTGNLGTTTVIATTANLTTVNSGLIQNGNSNVTITANANVTITSKSNATVLITDTGANIAGTANITGLISAGDGVTVSGNISYTTSVNDAGTVTQLTSKATPVTANGRSGRIVTASDTLVKNTSVTFTVNNDHVAANDLIILNLKGGTVNVYTAMVVNVNTNSFQIQIRNHTNVDYTEALTFNFAVLKVT